MIFEQSDTIVTPNNLVVRQSAQDFARVLTETQEYTDFLTAVEHLRNDQEAQQAIAAFQEKQKSLQVSSTSGSLSPDDQAELERLHQTFIKMPSVEAYFKTQDNLMMICQEAAQQLSRTIGLNYPSACSAGCCG